MYFNLVRLMNSFLLIAKHENLITLQSLCICVLILTLLLPTVSIAHFNGKRLKLSAGTKNAAFALTEKKTVTCLVSTTRQFSLSLSLSLCVYARYEMIKKCH